MRKKKAVVAVCVALLFIISTGVGCAPTLNGTQDAGAVSSAGPLVAADISTSGMALDEIDDSGAADESGTASSCAPLLEENSAAPTGTDCSGTASATPAPQASASSAPANDPAPASSSQPAADPAPQQQEPPPPAAPPAPASTPDPTPEPTPAPTPEPAPDPPQTRTICNTCGTDITGNVPAHGDGHLLNGEDFSYRVE